MSRDRNIVIAYMNSKHEVIKRVRCVWPNPALERAGGYMANQHVSSAAKGYAVYAEVYEADTTILHGQLWYNPKTRKVLRHDALDPRYYEKRYAVAPLLE